MRRLIAFLFVLLASVGAYAQPCTTPSPVPGVPCTQSMIFKGALTSSGGTFSGTWGGTLGLTGNLEGSGSAAFTGSWGGVLTLAGAGTALSVTNNATIGGVASFGAGSNNIMTVTPGATTASAISVAASGTGFIRFPGLTTMGFGDVLNTWSPTILNIINGSSSAPVSVGQPTMLINRTQQMTNDALCGGNPNAADCNSALTIKSQADSTDRFIASGIHVVATSARLDTGGPPGTQASGAIFLKAQVDSPSPSRAISLYSVGVLHSTAGTASAWGAEIGPWNLGDTGQGDCGLNPGDVYGCIGMVINSRVGFAGHLPVSRKPNTAALWIQSSDGGVYSGWQNAIAIDEDGMMDNGISFRDDSVMTTGTSIKIGGTKLTGIDYIGATITHLITGDLFVFNATPELVIGNPTTVTGSVFGGNQGLQLITTNATPGNTSSIVQAYYGNNATGPVISGYKNRATSTASHTAVQTSDGLLIINGYGDDGSADVAATQIAMRAASTISSGIVSGQIIFRTANTSGVLTTALTITDAQQATFPGVVRANTGFNANGSAGISATLNVRAAGGLADCTITTVTGIVTATTC